MLGVAGALEPRIPLSAFEAGRDLPLRFTLGAVVAVSAGAIWAMYLVLVAYTFD